MSFAAANQQWVGLAKETTPGIAIAAPTMWVPVDSPTYHQITKALTDGALRGNMSVDYQQQQGSSHTEAKYKTYLYMDSAYPHLLAILGTPDVVSGLVDPWTHKTALYNGNGTNAAQPATYTVFIADALGKVQQIPGCIPSDVKISVGADMLVSLDVTWIGLIATAIAPPVNTPSVVKPAPSWDTVVSIGGVASSRYSTVEIDIKRATEPIITITGTQAPYAIFGGPVSVSGSLNAVYQGTTDTDWQNYLTNGQPALTVKLVPPGDTTHYLLVQCSQVAYDDASYSGTNKWMEIKSTIKGLANSTDALSGAFSPVQVQLLTPVSTAY
ncbi:phage tail tube protein [Subtercola vilae]|uniref:Phage tail protein n=1 Tax=Subtercola vilae TaxID=2056433 RepID=A0A4V4RER4_9MICO|nr:phage tail tube protein [Subtercola vilae]TIH34974.1 hypothetical protein D4765_11820 [Subtercola vilae]